MNIRRHLKPAVLSAALALAVMPAKAHGPEKEPGFEQVGRASWYGPGFHGKKTASGERFDQNGLTAAHRTLPLGTTVEVTNLETGKRVELRINDRGPFKKGRVIDVSKKAAQHLGMDGIAQVRIEAAEENLTAAREKRPDRRAATASR